MKTYRNHTKLVFIILIIAAAFGLLVALVVMPLLSELSLTKARIAENETKLGEIASEIANYKVLKENFVKVSKANQNLSKMFPIRETSVSLVEGLEKATSAAGLRPDNLTITDVLEKAEKPLIPIVIGTVKVEEIPYALQFTGNYRDLADFFFYIEHLPFITVMDKLTVSAEKTQVLGGLLTNTASASMKFEGLLFIQKPQ